MEEMAKVDFKEQAIALYKKLIPVSQKRCASLAFSNYYLVPIGCCLVFFLYYTTGIQNSLLNGVMDLLLIAAFLGVFAQMIYFSYLAGSYRYLGACTILVIHLILLLNTQLLGIWTMFNPLIIVEMFLGVVDRSGMASGLFRALRPYFPLLYRVVNMGALAAFGFGMVYFYQERARGRQRDALKPEDQEPKMNFYDYVDELMPGFSELGKEENVTTLQASKKKKERGESL